MALALAPTLSWAEMYLPVVRRPLPWSERPSASQLESHLQVACLLPSPKGRNLLASPLAVRPLDGVLVLARHDAPSVSAPSAGWQAVCRT